MGCSLDPRDPAGEVMLYDLSVEDPSGGAWHNLCTPDLDGLALGFPVAGAWTPAGQHLRTSESFQPDLH